MKNRVVFFLFVSSLLYFYSCTTRESGPPVSTGRNAEVLIYSKKSIWEGATGDSIREIFFQPQQGLNQVEPMFRLLHLEELDKLFKRHRNILNIVISDTIKEATLEYTENLYARPQTFVRASAPNSDELIKLLLRGQNTLFDKFRKTDFARIQAAYSQQLNPVVQNKIKNQFGLNLKIPASFFVAKQEKDFMWLRLETPKYSQGLMIYRKKFQDSATFNADFLTSWKNKITKIHIPGQIDGSYMMTDTLTQATHRWINHNVGRVLEVRGLWITMNDFMGGPFLTLFMVDPKQEYVYALDSYVYYPSQDKRDLVLQLEAIMHSAVFE